MGPPIDLLACGVDELEITRRRRFPAGDPDLVKIGVRWEQAPRQAVARLPQIRFRARPGPQLVEPSSPSEAAGETEPPASQRPPS